MLVFERRQKPEKTLSRYQHQTKPTYDFGSENRTRDTLFGHIISGSHHCVYPAPVHNIAGTSFKSRLHILQGNHIIYCAACTSVLEAGIALVSTSSPLKLITKYTSDSLWKIWLVEGIQSIHNSLWAWHGKCNICCRYCIYHVKFNVCLVTKPLGVFSSETKWLNASLLFLRMNYVKNV